VLERRSVKATGPRERDGLVVERLTGAIRRMWRENGAAVILVEQRAEIALCFTETALVSERGRVVHQGVARTLLEDPAPLDPLVGLRIAGRRGQRAG
jgi:ABC-type branched-subunit amino acid transport system ATPase component